MTNHGLIKKVIGEINPVGESNADAKRFENLKEMCNLVESLLYDIDDIIAMNQTDKRHSVVCSVEYARNFMKGTVKNLVID